MGTRKPLKPNPAWFVVDGDGWPYSGGGPYVSRRAAYIEMMKEYDEGDRVVRYVPVVRRAAKVSPDTKGSP